MIRTVLLASRWLTIQKVKQYNYSEYLKLVLIDLLFLGTEITENIMILRNFIKDRVDRQALDEIKLLIVF